MTGAPRPLSRLCHAPARGAWLALCLWCASLGAGAAGGTITNAEYTSPTTRYGHAVLGDAIEWGALTLTLAHGERVTFTLPQDHVFEDVAPRLADVDGDGAPEVIVVETDVTAGGALAIYGAQGKIAETPHIGTTNRWLAPVGGADLDKDGAVELAYIDRPHLAKTLRIWRFDNGALTEVAHLPGLTNHRIGEADIAGGIRECGDGPEMILATGNWSDLILLRWDGRRFDWQALGSDTTRPAFARAMACQ
ncbi:FG-GAP repeat domain-containing protein [Tateyamaria sp. 1078]|uniref:FG-GAP repeat domain-containing protein n=1 Tax=Tateyamaria sp. 1078 TaxID=3417464 RepID=UPI003EBA0B58